MGADCVVMQPMFNQGARDETPCGGGVGNNQSVKFIKVLGKGQPQSAFCLYHPSILQPRISPLSLAPRMVCITNFATPKLSRQISLVSEIHMVAAELCVTQESSVRLGKWNTKARPVLARCTHTLRCPPRLLVLTVCVTDWV